MGNPYLNRDESIILTTHNVKFGSIVTELILTNQRLILFDSAHAQFRFQTMPLTTIETVLSGEDTEGNPIISLSISPPTVDSAPQTKELIFSQQAQGERTQERDKWAQHLREQVASARQQAPRSIHLPPTKPDIIFEETQPLKTDSGAPADSSPDEIRPEPFKPVITPTHQISEYETGYAELQETPVPVVVTPPVTEPEGSSEQPEPVPAEKTPLSDRFHPPPPSSGKPRLMTIAAAIIVILAIIVVAYVYAPTLLGNPGESVPSLTPAMTTTATTLPVTTLQQTPTPQVTTAVTHEPTPLPVMLIPVKGVWVRVQYAGNYTGLAGTSGYEKEINASGEQFYQLPIIKGIVEVSIQKRDGSAKVITVEVYNNGTMVANSTKASPYGTVDLVVKI